MCKIIFKNLQVFVNFKFPHKQFLYFQRKTIINFNTRKMQQDFERDVRHTGFEQERVVGAGVQTGGAG